jgi:DNA invertase Pin-like site-specific DNA recombinase
MGTTAIYVRVSTRDQDLEQQEQNLWEYATDSLSIDSADIVVLRDKSTGTDTDRGGYRDLMQLVRDDEADRVIVREITRIGRNFRDIHETVHEIVEDHNAGLSVTNDNLEIEPGGDLSMRDKMFLSMLAWGAELEAKKIRENTIEGLRAAEAEGKWVGHPPYGFTTDDDGYLQPNDNFANAVEAIYAVDELGWSDRKAARHTGVPRRTVPNVLERKDLYLSEERADEDVELEAT